MARGFVSLESETTPDAETLNYVLRIARENENNFYDCLAVKIANAIRGVRP